MKNEVIYIDKPDGSDKPVKFTHGLSVVSGWLPASTEHVRFQKIIYLGKRSIDGDMFACHYNGKISIYKGHLNSGRY